MRLEDIQPPTTNKQDRLAELRDRIDQLLISLARAQERDD
jgi:hypothetical protein